MPRGRRAVAELNDAGTLFVGMVVGIHRIRGDASRLRVDLENQEAFAARNPRGSVRSGGDLRLDGMRVVVFRGDEPGLKFFRTRIKPRVPTLAKSRDP